MKKAVLVLGPTASGKSRLALELAIARQLPIINVDSIQMYKGLKIGSALPSSQDMKLAAHSLYAFVEKGEQITAADYVGAVKKLVQGRDFLHRDLIFCGGSGFYIQALVKGMFPVAKVNDEQNQRIEKRIADEGWAQVHRWVIDKDPSLQRTVHVNDHYRIRRAVEMLVLSEKKPSELDQELTPSPIADFQKIKVALYADKDEMRQRVTLRAEEMLQAGFIEEVQELLNKGFAHWAPLQSVGYKEVGLFLRGELSQEQLVPAIVTANMQLIKKQLTWFRKDAAIRWFELKHLAKAKEYILEQLG